MLAVVFPGQGSQSKSAADALRALPMANGAVLRMANAICDRDLLEELSLARPSAILIQPAIVSAELTLMGLAWDDIKNTTSFWAGHSLGEFAALCGAGALTTQQAVQLVLARGRLMQELCGPQQAMMAVEYLSTDSVHRLLRDLSPVTDSVFVACVNSPESLTLAGDQDGIDRLASTIPAQGGVIRKLRVPGAFHTPYFASAEHPLKLELMKVGWETGSETVISNVRAREYPSNVLDWPDVLASQLSSCVRWEESLRLMFAHGVTHVLEIGPKPILARYARSTHPTLNVFSFCNPSELQALQDFIRGVPRSNHSIGVLGRALAGVAACGRTADRGNENWASYRSLMSTLRGCIATTTPAPAEACREGVDLYRSAARSLAAPHQNVEFELANLERLLGSIQKFGNSTDA